MRSLLLKRALDLVVSVTALVVLALPLLIIVLLVRVFLGRPIFYCAERPGLHGGLFRLIKSGR